MDDLGEVLIQAIKDNSPKTGTFTNDGNLKISVIL